MSTNSVIAKKKKKRSLGKAIPNPSKTGVE
jgi:hypothetical protein